MKKIIFILAVFLMIVSCDNNTNSSNGTSAVNSNENTASTEPPVENSNENNTSTISPDNNASNTESNSLNFESYSARATYYDYTDTVATGITFVPSGVYKCAMHEDTLNEGYEGACIEITGPNGTIKAQVIDCLPRTDNGVKKDDIDIMTSETFSKIANVVDGRVNITWKVVALPTSGPIQYQIKDGSNKWWIGIRPQNQKYPIAKIEVYDNDWKTMSKDRGDGRCYNLYVYQASGDGLSTPLKIRVTDINGTVIEDTLNSIVASTTVNGTKNF